MKTNAAAVDLSGLERLRARVMSDPMLQARLGAIEDAARFMAEAAAVAAHFGIAPADAVGGAPQPDPLGLARWTPTPPNATAWPPAPWLPVGVVAFGNTLVVDWAYFGTGPLGEPFFEDEIRRAISRPFNRLFRYRMTLADFLADAPHHRDALGPSGFIFHMSRCGSTLVARMLAALPQSIVVSEAAPIDTIVQLGRGALPMTAEQHAQALAAMVAAYGRRRAGDERRYVIKLDAWHALALPLFRRAFPDVPWIFLYRDPVEVLVSQMHQPGTQMIPDIVHPGLFDIDPSEAFPDLNYCARVLAKICAAALEHANGGIAANYRDLPGAVFTKILPHFALAVGEPEREAMQRTARQDAKAPSFPFTHDSETKQREATELVRTLADRHLGDVYRRLEAWRG